MILIERLKMLFAQSSSSSIESTTLNQAYFSIVITGDSILRPINKWFFQMMSQYMFGLAIHKFKILQTVIGSHMVFMVDFLTRQKLSTKMLFHNMSMLQDSLATDPNPVISIISKLWLTSFKQSPLGRNIVVSMSLHSASMHRADEISLSSRFIAGFKFTNHYPYSSALCQ